MNKDPLQELRNLRTALKYRAQKLRLDANILIAKAEAIEVVECDLDLALHKVALATQEDSSHE